MTPPLSPVQVWALFTLLALAVTGLVAIHDWIERGLRRRRERLATEQLKRGLRRRRERLNHEWSTDPRTITDREIESLR